MKRNPDPASASRARRIPRATGQGMARLGAVLALMLALCAGLAQAGPYDTWAKYKTLTINTTATGGGANVSGTVTNFPVLVRLTTSNADEILDEALASGADVRFASSDGSTALSYQIERWSSTAADIWVLVPSVTGNSTTDIRVYWQKSGQSTASSASSVFATSNSFTGVWHLGETGNSNADGYADATGNAAHAQGTNFGGGNEAAATIGNGQTFAYASSRKITVKTGAEANFDITSAITVSAWINITSWNVIWQAIVTKGEGSWRIARNAGNGTLNFACNGLTTNTSITGGTTLSTGTWYYVTGVYDGSNLRMYLNGASDATALAATGSISTTNSNVMIGENEGATGRFFNGPMDEVRVENTARSANWIKLSYETQKSNATYLSFGPTVATTFYWHRNSVLTSSTDFSRAYNWTLNSDGTGRRPASSPDDAFTGSYNGSWTCQDSDDNIGTGTCSAATNYGQLTLNGQGYDVFGPQNEFTALRRSDITGNFDVVVKVTSLTANSVNSKAALFMADNFASLGSGGYAGIGLRGDGKAEFLSDESGTVGEIETFSQSAVLITPSGGEVTGAVWLRLVKNGSSVSGYYRTSQSSAWTQQGSTATIQNTDANSQIALLHTSQNEDATGSAVFDEFQAGMPLSATDLDLSFAGTGSNADANATLSASQAAASIDFTGYGGTFNFGSYTLTINTGDADFTAGSFTAGSGTLAFTGNSGTQTFTPRSGATFPDITKSGASGTVAVATTALTADAFTLTSGTWQWGSGMTHTITSISTSAGSMNFGSSTVRVSSGNANLSSLSTVTTGTGTLSFTGTSGTQVLTPPSALTLPATTHTGASTLQLATNALSCVSFNQSAGVLDFNSKNITTTGDFTVSSGTSTSFSNLNGRTITVGGDASFAGQSGNLLNMNATSWTITATGSLTAQYATVGGSNASGGTAGSPTNCTDSGNNTNWLFVVATSLSNLSRSMRINFNTSAISVSGNVTNIPLLVRLTSSNFTFSATSADGKDVLFVDKDGTMLYHEVVEWDKANQTGKVWVRVPQVDGSSTTDYMTLYYGCDSCTYNSYENSETVFSAFQGVFHLNAPEEKAYDATSFNNHGTYYRNQPNAAGITSKNAVFFDGQDSSAVNVPVEGNYDITTNVSVWAWFKVNSFSKAYQAIVAKGDNSFRLSRNNATNNLYFAGSKSSTTYSTSGSVNVNDGNWHLAVGTYDGSNVKLYVDGVQDGSSTALTGSLDNSAYSLYIGENAQQLGRTFNGSISEVRIGDSASVLSADFIKVSYQNQKENSTFFTYYTTASFQSTKVFKLNTTPSGANVTGDVSNFPLLLRITGSTIIDGVEGTGTNAPADIRFLDGDGVTWLDYQVERWDRSLDSAEVWVRVPTVEGNYAGHTITMYYKQAASVTLVDGQCASCVFQTSNSFVGNWHLNTSGTGTRPDATGNSYSLTTGNYAGSELKGGVIAGADSLNGSNQYLSIGANLSNWSTGFTYTGWAWWSGTASYARLFDFGNGAPADNFWTGRNGTTTAWSSEIYNNTTSGTLQTVAAQIATGAWGHFAVTINGTNVKMYKNGSLVSNTTSGQSLRNATRSINYLGRSNWAADGYYQGKLDEIAIANTPRDANWIKLAYQNQRRDSTPLFNPSPADFVSTQKYTFNTTKTGANVSGNVTDFPLLVRITGSTIVDAVQTNAPDIRFLDADGTTWLDYQIERWDKTLDSAEVWVLVPQVDGNSDHDYLTLYYNDVTNGAVTDNQCSDCVFSTSNSHTGVWHLSEETAGTGTASVYKDATGNAYHGTDMISATGRVGMVGLGHQFDNTDDYINLVAGNTLLPNTSTPITMSAWFSSGSFTAGGGRILGFPKSDSTTALGLATISSGTSRMEAFINGTGNKGATTLSTSTWYHSAVSWDGTTYRLYINGSQDSSYVAAMTATTAATARIGIRTTSQLLPFDGYIDEVRFSQAARSADWIKLDYETQRRASNVFWNTRVGPNNTAILSATATSSSNIALSWPSSVTDSTNADSVGIWVGYSAAPDSANIAGATFVAKLAKTDTVYSYPATYSATYYFALAVRNSSGKWSPFTAASTDTVTFTGTSMPDTIYVDSARGNSANSCAAAQNPATPKKTAKDALACGASATDTLVVRVMRGTYYDSAFSVTASKPSIVTSFDINSRAVFNGAGSGTLDGSARVWTLLLYGNMGIRNLDVKCLLNGYTGVYVTSADNVFVEGCRIYGSSGYKHNIGIYANGGNQHHFANNLIHEPIYYGLYTTDDNSFNVVNNTFVGPGGTAVGFSMANNASASDMTLSNNIFYNWDYGLSTWTSNIGSCASNQFFMVTSGREVTTATCTGSIMRDPLFANTTPTHPNGFKLLPGSPAIDAGSATYGSGAQAATRRSSFDLFGSTRTLGAAPDIGIYEGSGYTPNPSGEFDTLQVSSTATTATVQNSKWKLVWDKARGAGITGFYDKISDPTAVSNLVYTNSLLFDAKIGAYTASSQTGVGPLLYLVESTRARAVVRQNLPVSASIDLNIYYTVYPSGHVYVQSELSNLSAGSTAVTTVDYTLRLGSTSAAYTSADSTRGFGYLTTASRDAMLSVTRNLDGGASGAERWAISTAATGTPGTVVFNTTDLADLSQNTVRRHDFLLYVGETALDFGKSAALNTDAYAPSPLTMTTGSLLLERSWQDNLQGHWTLDDGAGASARDKSVFVQNNATLAGANYKWVSGKVNGGLYLTATDSAYVASTGILNPGNGFTAMFWLKPDFTGMGDTAMIVSKGLSNASGWYCRKVASNNKVLFNMGGTTVTSPSLTDLAWSHIAVVSLASGNRNLEMYVNGIQVSASTAAAVATSNSLNMLMGYASGAIAGAKFKGTLDDVRVYGRQTAGAEIQSIYNRGFSSRFGHYALRADNNNRVVALINPDTAKTRLQPAFTIANWYGPRTPKFVYLNGVRLTPNVDFVSDTVTNSAAVYSGSFLALQVNKVITGAAQTLFIDDDDSSGFLGTASAMKALTISSTAGDKITIKNFSDTVFGGATSGQWYMELDLNGWATPTRTTLTDTGFGEINVWKAAAVSPSVAISTAYQMVGWGYKSGRSLSYMKMDTTGSNEVFTAGVGSTTTGLTYALTDSSSTRLSLTVSGINLSQGGTVASVTKRFTFYPTGRVFVSYAVTGATIDLDAPRVDLNPRYDGGNPLPAWSNTVGRDSARQAFIGGSDNFHSIGLALLGVKNNAANYATGATMLGSSYALSQFGASNDQNIAQFNMPTSIWTGANKPVTVNFMMDFSSDFSSAAMADSLLRDAQRPAVLTAIAGTRVTSDPLDFNTDNFAEGDGAYTFQSSAGGLAHFRFVNPVASFNPAFRISSWTYGVLPEFVIVDNQVLVKGYHYNAYLNTATSEVILQINKTLAAGTHVIYISHKSGLAVTLRAFTAKGGEGADTLAWTTESEFENLGYNVWRRPVMDGPGDAQGDSGMAEGTEPAAAGAPDSLSADTLPSRQLSPEELAALGYVRINAKLIPGAKGGSSASTLDYQYIDRTAAFGSAYEYLLEAVDFNDGKVQYGPRKARPLNPLATELLSNYPNPFNPITTLRFTLKEKLKVSLIIYDSKGRLVRTLARGDKAMLPGKYRLIWDARNEGGFEVPSGQYFYRFTAGRYVKTRKMILVK